MVERLGKCMSASEIRGAFLEFFADRGHTVVPSSSLVPHKDPTLLFTNAGMVQFKDVFLGHERSPYKRAVTSQKCVRAGGKHNDLDNVGFTARHHTFFEMLGNFSFGDYFKESAIAYGWEFLTKVLKLPKDRLWITVYEEDDEAADLWRRIANVSPERIVRLDEKENFWAMGDTGPCGPCSEIVVDRGEEHACGDHCGLGACDCDRWLEIWNLVFMQYMRDEHGRMSPLPRPSIDTGMGLERIASVLQGASTNYGTDLFVPIVRRIEEMSGKSAGVDGSVFPFHVIADHIRSCVFLASDGVQPSNEGRGYVMRRILRRAVRFGRGLGIDHLFMAGLVPVVVDVMGDAYPELNERREYIETLLREEEGRFLNTLMEGQKRAEDLIASARDSGHKMLSGKGAFVLYDTFGFPIDLTKDMAREAGLGVDELGFDEAMAEQRKRSRAARADATEEDAVVEELLNGIPATRFAGHEELVATSRVLALVKDNARTTELEMGDEAIVALDVTPFYAAGGGQESDTGTLALSRPGQGDEGASSIVAEVVEVGKTHGGVVSHKVRVRSPGVMVGQTLSARVDPKRRQGLRQHHTATHLIHSALRKVLGEQASQSGSLVQEDRLRFDFAHFQALSPSDLIRLEDAVNDMVMADVPVIAREMPRSEAEETGAIALFGEKYGEVVRVVEVPGYSKELCGGTHVSRTGEIGQIRIVSESAVAAGLRRLEAVAGVAALARARQHSQVLTYLAGDLGVGVEEVSSRVKGLLETVSALEKAVAKAKRGQLDEVARELLTKASLESKSGNRKMVVSRQDGLEMNDLRALGDRLRDRGASVVVLGSAGEGRCSMVVMVHEDAAKAGVDAVAVVRKGAAIMGGSGGGKSHLAQAGGKDPGKLDEALSAAAREAREILGRVCG